MFRSTAIKLIIHFLLLGSLASNCSGHSQEQITKVLLREIAHEFLLQMNDSTSRILPVKKIDEYYRVEFEKSFSFEPDLLFFSCYKILTQSEFKDSFIVEVKEINNKETMHSFMASAQMNLNKTACKLRGMPPEKYAIHFTPLTRLTVHKKEQKLPFLVLGILIILGLSLFIYKYKKHHKNQKNLISIGMYKFDPKGMFLIYNSEKIELSGKESDLLDLLHSNKNTTLERDDILNKVWRDEGNYIGRTLDVYISKLRKKLEKDPKIKIINTRGIGYRFVIE